MEKRLSSISPFVGKIAKAAGDILAATVCVCSGAHAYTFRSRRCRKPTALNPAGAHLFEGYAEQRVYDNARNLSTKGVLPLADQPPVRSRQKPYSTVQDNPERTAMDL